MRRSFNVWTIGFIVLPADLAPVTAFERPSQPGKSVITASRRVANGGLNRQMVLQSGHVGSIQFFAFSPDGKLLATGGEDWTIRLWELRTGQLRKRDMRTLPPCFRKRPMQNHEPPHLVPASAFS